MAPELAGGAVRVEILAALWAIVREWGERGCVRVTNTLATFEEWTGVVGAMVRMGGFADPLEIPDLPDGGDREGHWWRFFLGELAGDGILPGEKERFFSTEDCMNKAEELEAGNRLDMVDLVGSPKDVRKTFGRRMVKWRGRHLQDSRGRTVEFGQRRQARARGYECRVIAEGKGEGV